MSTLSTNLYGSTINKGMGGLMSGLDTDDLVNQMTAGTRNKINRQYQEKQKLLYRQEAYREISTKLISFNNKYLSYSTGINNILSPKFFESYTFKSSSNYVNVTGNAENIKNFTIKNIESVASAANFSSVKKVTSGEFSSKEITDYISSLAGETFSLNYDGKVYDFTISKDFGKDISGNDIEDTEKLLNDLVTELNTQLATMKDKDGQLINIENNELKFMLSTDEGFKIELEKGSAKLEAASTGFLKSLDMEVGKSPVSGNISTGNLYKTAKDIMLDGNITFEFNGVLKTINLSEMRNKDSDGNYVDKYEYTAEGMSNFLQDKLDKEFGVNSVQVSFSADKLTFKAKNDTDIFGVSSISKKLSGFTGMEAGDYNRVNRNKSLKDLGLELTEETLSNGKLGYIININGTDLEIENTMTFNEAVSKINNSEAGVKLYYSSTTDTFTVKAIETGSHKGVEIGDGPLARALFGIGVDLKEKLNEGESIRIENGDMYIYGSNNEKIGKVEYNKDDRKYVVNPGTDNARVIAENVDYHINNGADTEMTYILNGVETTVVRSTVNFSIDEINLELNDKAAVDFVNPITFDVTNNSDEVVERVKQFIDDYNEIIELLSTKTSEKPNRNYLPLTPEQQDEMKEEQIKTWTEEAKKGILYGDSKMNTLLRSLRQSISGFTDVSSITLSSLGITTKNMDTSGKLMFDEKKFKEKLLENPDEIANLFTGISSDEKGISGIAVQLQGILKENVGAYGTSGLLIDEAGISGGMTSDKNFISEKIKEHESKMEDLKKFLEREKQRYWNQFSALEQSLNKLNMQSSWLTDMMGGNQR